MQQPGGMFPVMPSFPPTNITTEQIQKYLDENKKLILAILDNQNLGKLSECAQYQAQLQKNLMYLAAIADAQPQSPAMPPQMTPHPAMQQGGFYMQHPHTAGAAMAQQPGMFAARAPPFNSPHSIQDLQQQQQQQQQQHLQNQPLPQGQMGMRPIGATNGMHPPSNDTNLGGNKQDNKTGGGPGSDGQGNSAFGGGGGDGEAGK